MREGRLGPMEWALYRFMLEVGKCSVDELMGAIGLSQDEDARKRNLRRASRKLDKMIDEINMSSQTDKAIIWDRERNYSIVSREGSDELGEFIERVYLSKAFKALRKASVIRGKARMDGQGKLLDLNGNPIEEGDGSSLFHSFFRGEHGND